MLPLLTRKPIAKAAYRLRAMRLHHLALRTRHLDRLEAFYVGLLGLPVLSRSERGVWLDAGGTILMLEHAAEGEPTPSPESMELFCFAITAADRAAREQALGRAGVPLEGATQFTLYFRDPEGRRVGLSHEPWLRTHVVTTDTTDEANGVANAVPLPRIGANITVVQDMSLPYSYDYCRILLLTQ